MGGKWRKMAMVLAAAALAGCAVQTGPEDGSSSTQGTAAAARTDRQGPIYMMAQYDVERITINVPRSLVVSESNGFHPDADIVWRGEPYGDRYAQVEAILTEAMAAGTATMTSGPKVDVEITLVRFHCLTERTRYTVGGVHSMKFDLTLRDTETGAIIDGPRLVVADVEASGGASAIAEDAAGMTQRVVVTDRLARAIRFALSRSVPASEGAALAALAAMPTTTPLPPAN